MTDEIMPYIDSAGNLIIPFGSGSKYHYWNSGLKLLETLSELKVTADIWGKYAEDPYPS